jgi:predicted nucleic acid-binding protein
MMMVIVIDTSMIFSILLGKNSKMRDLLFELDNEFYSPNYTITEIFEKKEKILKYSDLTESELYELMYRVLERINFIREDFVSEKNKNIAYKLCKDIDEEDTPIIALALELDAFVWTGDKKIISALTRKGFDRFFKR